MSKLKEDVDRVLNDLVEQVYDEHLLAIKEKRTPSFHTLKAKKQLAQAVLDSLPEPRSVDWSDISTPELVAAQSEAYGFNQAVLDIKQAIEKWEG